MTVTGSAYVCNGCGKIFGLAEYGSSDAAGEAVGDHIFEDFFDDCENYSTKKVTYTYYIHHDAETETVTHEVVTGRTCTKCGAHEDKSEQDAPTVVVKYGDVDGSGSVDSCDALEVLRHTVGLSVLSENGIIAGDVDGNNQIDVCDALFILKRVVGLIDKFPVEDDVMTDDYKEPLIVTEDSYVCNYCGKAFKISEYSVDGIIDAIISHLAEELTKGL